MKYFTVCLFLACAIGTYAESVPYIVDCSIIRCQEGQVCEMRAAEDCTKNCQLLPICVAKSIPDVVASSNSTDCPVNEEFLKCGTACEPSCSDKDDGPKICTKQCIVDVCQCKKGFVRNAHKQCVKRKQCGSVTPICPVNEEFRKCGSACEPKCSDEPTEGPKMCTMNCIDNVCQCKVGFVRNEEGNCVRKADCDAGSVTPICPVNEEFRECGSACEPKCSDKDTEGPKMCTMNCIDNVCQCKVGFVRNADGKCVRKADCDAASNSTDCPVNEEFLRCGTACEPSCSDKKDGPKICTKQCIVDVCQCKKGFVRNAHKQCVRRKQCGSVTPICPKNEEFRECGSACEPKCSDEPTEGPKLCTMNCIDNVCQCKVGFVRNEEGNCVRKADCDSEPVATCETLKCPENMKCKVPTLNCFTTPCPQPPAECVSSDPKLSCQDVKCPSNYFCIQAMRMCLGNEPCEPQTPPKCVPKEEEKYNPCAAHSCLVGQICQPKKVQCVSPPCKPVAECVPQNQTSQCPENEVFNACGGCENTCENKNMICPAICRQGKCVCGLGFYRHNGVCVKESECSAEQVDPCATVKCSSGQECRKVEVRCLVPPCEAVGQCFNISELEKCGENEKFNSCGACDGTCKNPNTVCPAICRFPGSCGCIPGYVRSNGKCIAQKDCPAPKCKDNEELKKCGTACEPSCTNPNPICTKQCVLNVCQCKEGLVRNDNGDCVKEEGCKKECGVNQQFLQCGTACEPTCTNPRPTCTRQCVPNVCQCERGFMRDQNGNCVSLKQCAQTTSVCAKTKCAADEVCQLKDVQCVKEPCDPVAECVKATVTCANVRIICKPGTECGMVDGKPTCVPTKCSEDEELKTCGTACEPSCQNPNPICTKQCVPNVCQCKEGLVRNDNGECVKEEGCKKECGVNQQFLQCGTACEPTCTNPRPTCTRQCVPNVCQCERGFMRDQNGNCVSLKQCAQTTSVCAKTKCAADEVCQLKDVQCVKEPCDPVAECVKATVTCANVRIICKPGTECGKVDGKPTCVPIKCSEDEELKTCGSACEPSCQNPNPICTKQCVPNVCQCKDGLVRNDNGKCVKEEGCKKECGVNQQFLQCGTACEPTCTNPRPTCSKQCVPNVCQCQRGFMRDQNGNCVSLKQCAQTISICAKTKCAANEVCQLKNVVCVMEPCDPVAECVPKAAVTCANARILCEPGTECGMVEGKPTCVPKSGITCANIRILCKPGERCGMITGKPTCVPICTENEVLGPCSNICEKNCATRDMNLACRPDCSRGPQCACAEGFYRNPEGKCVTEDKCEKIVENCDNKKCVAGGVCQMTQVQCVRAPCPPLPVCVPDESLCNVVKCNAETECKVVVAPCLVPPCPYVAKCVPKRDNATTPTTCGAFEEFKKCGTNCELTCRNKDAQFVCNVVCVDNVCQCQSGYVRDYNRKCIKPEGCPKEATCSGENEEVKYCGTACEPSCQNPTPVCTKQCVPDVCQCKKGFVRDENNRCIEQTQCSAGPTCSGENEEMKQCGTACEPSCENPTPTCTKQCVPNLCQCKKGFVRDENNKCIEQTQCPEPITPCATMRCKAGYVCVTRKVECNKEPCAMTAGCVLETCETKNCPEGSKCEEAEVKCPADVECPRPPPICVPDAGNNTKCGSFEELKKCGTACEPSCANIGKDVMCTKQCIVDVCQCQDGYVRDHNNRCIEEKECPKEPTCNGDNEEMTQCGTACEPSCKNPSPICTMQCVPNLCHCKKGFVRDENNKCVKETECPKVSEECGLNEELRECGTACEPSCTNPEPTVCTEQCLVNVCQCKKGFVRDQETTKCVPLEKCSGYSVLQCSTRECPEGSKCVKLEVQEPPKLGNEPRPPVGPVSVCDAEKCFPECVEGQVCKYKDNRDCPTLICARKMQCEPDVSLCNVVKCTAETECKVVETQCLTPPCPYQAKCVPKINNTTCGSFEELKKCGTACEPSCANLGKDVICTKQCIVDVCQCQKGYVRDENKRCIPEKECPKEPTCGTNEEFLKCGSACQPSCENPNPICTKQCIPDVCQCKKGFVRDGEGKCVSQKECSAVTKECGSNEELRECGTACEPTCMNPRPKVCTEQCLINVCQCKKGFVRDPDTSDCVPLTECSGQASILCTDRNCPKGTVCIQAVNSGSGKTPKIILPDGVTDLPIRFTKPVPSSLPTPSICTVPVMTCEKARLNCAKNETCGYDSGFPICVPVKKECGSNEEFRACGTACEPYCLMPERRTCTEKCVENVCQCEEGFMRDLLTKKCVLLEQCRMASMPCSQRKCPEGFFCVDAVSSPPMELPKGPILPGVTGQTIYVTDPPFGNPPSMCTEAPMKCPVNEEYVRCSGCPKNCGEEDKKCALVCGLPGCQCEDGYRRLLHNKMCVKEEECNTLKG